MAENGLDSSRIEVTILDPVTDECGLKCTRFDLKEGELIMEIPRKLMLTNEIEDKNANFGKTPTKSDCNNYFLLNRIIW